MPANHHYTIGWICPLALEMEAAQLVLEDKHQAQFQQAFYTGGRIGEHRVVMGVQSQIGLNAAAALATRMSIGFPNIKYFVLVGIAGGVPRYGPAGAASEIVLGDVVISSPTGNYGGVMQYDKIVQRGQGRLQYVGYTNGVPANLMTAVNNLRAQGSEFPNIAQVLAQMRGRLNYAPYHRYDDPGSGADRLFLDYYPHQGDGLEDCSTCCDERYVTTRDARGNTAWRMVDTPKVHFGNVASSNKLQISASERNRVQEENNVICFEMEAAGAMQEYPCVVVRGICDYADSHKNKNWQNYAAATAAAYAKVLLLNLPAL